MYGMSTNALTAFELNDAPRLRLLANQQGEPAAEADQDRAAATDVRSTLHLVPDPPLEGAHPVLIAGRDSRRRAAVREELSVTMPPQTVFDQAGAVWEVLALAPSSRMVVLSGELADAPTDSLVRMLAHRHPGLPIVSLEAPGQPG